MSEGNAKGLKRGLKNRHIQLIALGGAVGTGLFLGLHSTLKMTGPSVILGYAIAGAIAFLIMRQLGEMIVDEPVAGSFSYFAYKYWSGFAGFVAGWNYWLMFILVGMAELSAVAHFMQYWWDIAHWQSVLVFFLLINAVNLFSVRLYGEIESAFSLIKVATVIAMIGCGVLVLLFGWGGEKASVTNLWSLEGGFFAYGVSGFVTAVALIMFSFGGLETVGIAAAEAQEPQKTIPQAINQILWRILLFYIGSLVVVLALAPWTELVAKSGSPFVIVFNYFSLPKMAAILNFILLITALSVYNCGVYVNSRILYGLAQQGNAPKAIIAVNKRGVPVRALSISAVITALVIVLNYLVQDRAFALLMSFVVSTLVINWLMICVSHLKFRHSKQQQAAPKSIFPALFYPLGNYITLVFLCSILIILLTMPGMRASVIFIPFWLLLLRLMYQMYAVKKTV